MSTEEAVTVVAKSGVPVERVRVEVFYENDQAVVHDIKDTRIVSAAYTVVEKQQKMKDPETGALIGFEPTGEYEMTVKVKYIKAL